MQPQRYDSFKLKMVNFTRIINNHRKVHRKNVNTMQMVEKLSNNFLVVNFFFFRKTTFLFSYMNLCIECICRLCMYMVNSQGTNKHKGYTFSIYENSRYIVLCCNTFFPLSRLLKSVCLYI